MSEKSLLKRATLAEACDAMVLPPSGRRALFVLAGHPGRARANCALAEPADFSINVQVSGEHRQYLPDPIAFRLMPGEGSALVDLLELALFRFDTPQHDYFRVYFGCRDLNELQQIEAQLTGLAFDAASGLGDWRLSNVLEWCAVERLAAAGELQPDAGVKLPRPLKWSLQRPVFREGQDSPLYLWKLTSPAQPDEQRALLSCVTDHQGVVARKADLVPIQRLFAPPKPPPAPKPPLQDFSRDAAPAAVKSEVEPAAPRARRALSARQLVEQAEQKEKIRKLFEMSQ
ncbi:MAG TPA: hypothetical protein VHE37_13540 [Nevskiaceae bacterium]|nr:hypothetical protein [Nevskiaceae bacterium]